MRYLNRLHAVVGAVLVGLALCVPRTAFAIPEFPEKLRQLSGAECSPPCNVCHLAVTGGPSSETARPFAEGLKSYGLTPYTAYPLASLEDALLATEELDLDDADGDGTRDRAELALGFNPNPGDQRFCGEDAVTPTSYGCGAHIAPQPRTDAWTLACAVMIALTLVTIGRRR